MNLIGEHIENAIKAGKLKNPAELARKLDTSRATISRWMSGTSAPSAEEARALANVIGAPAGMVMAEAEAQRAKDDATRAEWLRVARWCKGQKEAAKILAVIGIAVLANCFFADGGGPLTESMGYVIGTLQLTDYGVLALVVTVTLFAFQSRHRPTRRAAPL